jgi:hypothetical protein
MYSDMIVCVSGVNFATGARVLGVLGFCFDMSLTSAFNLNYLNFSCIVQNKAKRAMIKI